METAFLVTKKSIYDFEVTSDHYLFKDRNDAINKKIQLVELSLLALDTDRFDYVIEDNSMAFTAYRDGEYSTDLIEIEVLELAIL